METPKRASFAIEQPFEIEGTKCYGRLESSTGLMKCQPFQPVYGHPGSPPGGVKHIFTTNSLFAGRPFRL